MFSHNAFAMMKKSTHWFSCLVLFTDTNVFFLLCFYTSIHWVNRKSTNNNNNKLNASKDKQSLKAQVYIDVPCSTQ